jgi:hypothetical protein
VLWVIGGIAVVFLVFGFGVAVGYHKALFSSSWGRNYYQNFYGNTQGWPMGALTAHAPWNAHGVAGSVIDVSSSTISLRDNDNDERSVVISSDTVIRKMNSTISVDMINVGDTITVIGEPNTNGQVSARFVRVFGASLSMP